MLRRTEATIIQHTETCLSSLLRFSAYYAGKLAPDERSANSVMRKIAEEAGRDGTMLNGPNGSSDNEASMQAETAFERLLWVESASAEAVMNNTKSECSFPTQQADEAKFIRWAYQDGMSLVEL